ncbi:MAG TPA: CHRD domain-containing protein [Acidimicrobiia bacterium]
MNNPLRLFALGAFGAVVLVSAACGDDSGGGEAVETSTTTSAPASTEVGLVAEMSGKDEVPGPGVTDGTGLAEVRITGEELCYKLNATMGEMPTAAHIHQGAKGAAGGVVVNLMPTFTKGESAFTAESCIKPDAAQAAAISASPDGFYVNIHTAEHPNGAMRGQLAKSGY